MPLKLGCSWIPEETFCKRMRLCERRCRCVFGVVVCLTLCCGEPAREPQDYRRLQRL